MRNSYFSDERVKVYNEVQVFHKTTNIKPPTWGDIKHIDFQDDDFIHVGYEGAYHSDNNSYGAHYFITVIRKIIETDEEFNERIERLNKQEQEKQERQYQSYLKLKQKFEPN